MKYNDVKDKIKDYFEKIDPDELYDLAISCGFKQIDKKNNMKLEDVKEGIDDFFKNHSSEEIYDLALKYGAEKVNTNKDKLFKRFKESLDRMSDEEFGKMLNEMQNDPEGSGMTIGEFVEKMGYEIE